MDVDDDDDTDTEDNPRASRISGMIKRGKKGGASGSKTEKSAILEEEPDLQNGVAAAIKLAESMGYWDKDKRGSKGDNLKHLQVRILPSLFINSSIS